MTPVWNLIRPSLTSQLQKALKRHFGYEDASADRHRGNLTTLDGFIRKRSAEAEERSQTKLCRSIVLPGLVHPDVLPEGRHGAVPGLVGDGPVARATQVGIGDETGPQRMG